MDIKAILEQEVESWGHLGHPAIMQRFVLAHGQVGQGTKKPKMIRPGVPRHCFMNAHYLAMEEGYRYMEGYAIRPSIPLPIHHAWVLNKRGKVIDNTWKDPEDAVYMGVEFTTREIEANMSEHDVYGMLDTGRGINTDLIFRRMPELETLARKIHSKMKLQSISN